MCRLAAYLGTEITLSRFLLEPEHSLVKQAWAPKEMLDGSINADGFGFAWLDPDNYPCSYKNLLPVWSDTNLHNLGKSLRSKLWLANVRGATPGQATGESNTQPFIKDNIIFLHNGCIKPFDIQTKARLIDCLTKEIQAEINGDSDSLYLFALFKQHFINTNNIDAAIIAMLTDLESICRTTN